MNIASQEVGTASTADDRARASFAVMAPLMASLWCLSHRYLGFYHDAKVYAFQALSRLEPNLRTDLFFQYGSQDNYTVFSPLYAALIRLIGLPGAAATLFAASTLGFYVAAWMLARSLFNRDVAWLALILPLTTVGTYGGFGVFHYSEQFLTARLPAEAIVVAALAGCLPGRRRLGIVLAVSALFVHPLLALPGVLMLILMWAPARVGGAALTLGCVLSIGISFLAATHPQIGHWLQVMDPAWASMVFERSEFLFPSDWSVNDWVINLRGPLCLGAIATTVADVRVRRLCAAAAAIAVAGLAIAFIGSAIGPIGIIVQGQPWRWVWIGQFLSVLLLLPAAFAIWKDQRCGPLCALLLLSTWMLSPEYGIGCAVACMAIWRLRDKIGGATAKLMPLAAAIFGIAIAVLVSGKYAAVARPAFDLGREANLIAWARYIGVVQLWPVLIAIAFWAGARQLVKPAVVACAAVVLLVTFAALMGSSFANIDAGLSAENSGSFAQWQQRIPPTSTVLTLRQEDYGSFAWLTLRRPNYLAMDQSAGLVFSRDTALEVRRRSEVILPVKDAEWKIHSHLRAYRAAPGRGWNPQHIHPLTADGLRAVCKDPLLGFVIAKEDVGFNAVRHAQRGPWADWNLYDCANARTL